MRRVLPLALIVLAVCGLGAALQPDNRPANAEAPAVLKVRGAGLKSVDLTSADLAGMGRRTLTVKEKDGAEAKYEGVTVEDILTKAGMTFGQSLRGARLRDYLVADASDGYGVVFALPEISAEFSDRVVIVADRVDGGPIPPKDGPLRVIVSDEKKHARWVRNVVSLSVQSSVAPPAPAR